MKYLIPIFGLFLAAAPLLSQTVIDETNANLQQGNPSSAFEAEQDDVAPELYEGEFEDLGPQYLLVPGTPAHDWFMAFFDVQWLNSSNPTQTTDSAKRSADLRVLTGHFAVVSPEKSFAGGVATGELGMRYQNFEYGTLSGDVVINGLPVSASDFDAVTFMTQVKWARDRWGARAGLRWTSLENDQNGHDFYNEWVPDWAVSRSFLLGANTRFTAEYDGAFHTTSGQSAFGINDNFNDRFSNAINLRLTRRLTSDLYLQPVARVNYSIYPDDPNGDREDTTLSVGLNLSYYFNKNAVLRIFGNYQQRDSTGVGITDYENLDIGLGGTLSFRF